MTRVLLVDNHDSFTFNIAHLVVAAGGPPPVVLTNDASAVPDVEEFTHVIIGPGPGTPDRASDLGHSLPIYRAALAAGIPVLGVCLGHQLMAVAHGGSVGRAPEPMHGRESIVRMGPAAASDSVLSALPPEFSAVRYHSLAVTELPPVLQAHGHSEDGVIQALAHRHAPAWGVQYHPESIRSEAGTALMRAFLAVSGPDADTQKTAVDPASAALAERAVPPAARPATHTLVSGRPIALADVHEDAERLFTALFADRPHAVWLDSASGDDRSRFSILGALDGPGSHVLTARVGPAETTVVREEADGSTALVPGPFFAALRAHVQACVLDGDGEDVARALDGFGLGYAGYLGYGLSAETLGAGVVGTEADTEADAWLVFLSRALVIDHERRCVRPLALVPLAEADEHSAWLREVEWEIRRALTASPSTGESPCTDGSRRITDVSRSSSEPHGFDEATRYASATTGHPVPSVRFRHGRAEYLRLIDRCHALIAAGESYELCLTNEGRVPGRFDALAVYRRLRSLARVPYGAFLRCGDLAVASASPERFLDVSMDGRVESRPIKGTLARAGAQPGAAESATARATVTATATASAASDAAERAALASSPKDRAENLMIVDLVRNDLSRVCEESSVRVPALFAIESFPTVHQMISTVIGQLARGRTALDALEAAFPGGSMTGAPKERTVRLLDALEGGRRGVYSGAIGWVSVSGALSLSIVIRTAVIDGDGARFGVGGAITRLSDPAEEYEETLTKARTVLAALGAPAPETASAPATAPVPATAPTTAPAPATADE
ncbi:MAG: chorismate-binding protein [Dermabacter sp.]|nr:chorismate-binding protein [Dermabacter sp.]